MRNGKRRTALLILALLMTGAMPLLAQSERFTDFGAIVSGKFNANLTDQWAIEVEEELRFDHNCTRFDRWLNSVSVEYPFLHNRMHVGLTGGAIRRYNDRGYYENRFRVGLDVNYSETFRRFKFSYRSRLMATQRDETVANYRVNPKLYWRHRLQASYQALNSRFKYTISVELHWLLNDPKASVVDNVRTVLSVDYRLSRHQHLEFSARMDNDIQVKKPVDRFYLGITYHYKL